MHQIGIAGLGGSAVGMRSGAQGGLKSKLPCFKSVSFLCQCICDVMRCRAPALPAGAPALRGSPLVQS